MGWAYQLLGAIAIAIFFFVFGKAWEREQWMIGRREKEIQEILEEKLYQLRRF